jgi:hypothetical protein
VDKNTSNGQELQAKSEKCRRYVPVGLIEQFILNYKAVPPEFGEVGNEWRNYRIEYGGHAQSCFMEKVIYLPRYGDSYVIELLFDFWQAEGRRKRRKILADIINELARDLDDKNRNS